MDVSHEDNGLPSLTLGVHCESRDGTQRCVSFVIGVALALMNAFTPDPTDEITHSDAVQRPLQRCQAQEVQQGFGIGLGQRNSVGEFLLAHPRDEDSLD